MSAATKPSRGERTRRKILRAAERLFATDGVEKVTLRQIAAASGQGNVSAVQYHFGSKEELLEQILAEHMGPLDHRRRELMDERELSGQALELEDLLRILVDPLVEKLDSVSGRAYLAIQAQRNPAGVPMPATKLLSSRIRRSLDGDSVHPMADRFAVLLLFGALRDHARAGKGRGGVSAEYAELADALVSALAGLFRGMSGPGRAPPLA